MRRLLSMRKILTVNKNPLIWTYTHHGYLHSIISANDKVSYNELDHVAKISVKDYNRYNWEIQNGQLKYDIDELGNINAYSNRWNLDMNLAFWRKCETVDEIELCIHKQLYSNIRSSITIFLTNDEQTEMTDMYQYDIKIANSISNGVYYSTGKIVESNVEIYPKPTLPLKLKLLKDNRKIYLEYVDKELQSCKILIKEWKNNFRYDRIGFAINLGNSSYYEWIFSNYIQLYSNLEKPMPIEYMANIHKNWHSCTMNYFIDYSYIEKDDLDLYEGSYLKFIERQIDLNRYLEFEINDKIHNPDNNDNEPFWHQDLIYGYDNEKQYLYLLYYKFGKIVDTTMSYSDFLSEKNKISDRKRFVFTLKYNPGIEGYELSKKHLLQLFCEYRDGINISYYEPELEKGYEIGINSLKCYCTKEGIEKLIYDIRISHLLYERAVCNKERIKYLVEKEIVLTEDYRGMVELLDDEIEKLFTVRNLCIRNVFGGRVNIERIEELMNSVLEDEKKFVDKIIISLQ